MITCPRDVTASKQDFNLIKINAVSLISSSRICLILGFDEDNASTDFNLIKINFWAEVLSSLQPCSDNLHLATALNLNKIKMDGNTSGHIPT